MKPSHLTTPRTLAECTFAPSMDPIERPTPMHKHDRIVMWGSLIAAVCVAVWGGM